MISVYSLAGTFLPYILVALIGFYFGYRLRSAQQKRNAVIQANKPDVGGVLISEQGYDLSEVKV